MSTPNYLKKIAGLHKSGSIPPGSLGECHIYHDEWCEHNKGGVCNCDPDIKYTGRTVPTDMSRFKSRERKR